MFTFGDPTDIAKMYVDLHVSETGPGLPDVHHSEMTEQELRNLLTYLHLCLTRGLEERLEDAVIEVLRGWYDEAFVALAEASERFRENMLKGFVFPPDGTKARSKYLGLVRKASES